MKALIALLVAFLPFAAWSQPYVGAAVGQSKFEVENDTAAKVFGGYQFTPNFALELGGHALGSTTVGNRTADFSAIDLSYFGTMVLSKGFSVHGRIGFYRAEITERGSDAGPTYGLGIGYALTKNAALRGEWQRFAKLGPGTEPAMNIDVLYLGVSYRFGD